MLSVVANETVNKHVLMQTSITQTAQRRLLHDEQHGHMTRWTNKRKMCPKNVASEIRKNDQYTYERLAKPLLNSEC